MGWAERSAWDTATGGGNLAPAGGLAYWSRAVVLALACDGGAGAVLCGVVGLFYSTIAGGTGPRSPLSLPPISGRRAIAGQLALPTGDSGGLPSTGKRFKKGCFGTGCL